MIKYASSRPQSFIFVHSISFFLTSFSFMTDTVDGADANCVASMENDYFVQCFMTFGYAMWPPAINVALLFRSFFFIVFHISQQNARPTHLADEDKLQACLRLTYQQLAVRTACE